MLNVAAGLVKNNMRATNIPSIELKVDLSGKRDSNPRPLAWEANALPTELLPHVCECKCTKIIRHSHCFAKRFYDFFLF